MGDCTLYRPASNSASASSPSLLPEARQPGYIGMGTGYPSDDHSVAGSLHLFAVKSAVVVTIAIVFGNNICLASRRLAVVFNGCFLWFRRRWPPRGRPLRLAVQFCTPPRGGSEPQRLERGARSGSPHAPSTKAIVGLCPPGGGLRTFKPGVVDGRL